MNEQRDLGISTQDENGNHYVAALHPPRSKAEETKRNPLQIHQIFYVTAADAQVESELVHFADGFETITAMLWSHGALHVLHGPHLTRLADTNGDGKADARVDISRIERWPPPLIVSSHPTDPDELLRVLADRTRKNEDRIAALWQLRSCVVYDMHISVNGTALSNLPSTKGFDPTKAWITALHNGPDALRIEAARVLRVSPKDTSPAIKGLIHRAKNDTNAKVRMEAALTLGCLKAKEAVAELFGSLDDPDDTARIAKILAIRAINEWELAPAFLNAASERTREGTLLALQDVYERNAIIALDFAVRSSPYPAVRRQAAQLLGRVIVETGVMDNTFMNFLMMDAIRTTTDEDGNKKYEFPELPRWSVSLGVSPQRVDLIEDALRVAQKDEDEAVRAAAELGLMRIESTRK